MRKGDVSLKEWEDVEEVIDSIEPDTTLVITGPFNEDEETDYRVRWVEGTDLEPLGGIKGSEEAQIHYLTYDGDWMEIQAF